MTPAPSIALRALERALAVLPAEQPVTAGVLTEKVSEVAAAMESAEADQEWEDPKWDRLDR